MARLNKIGETLGKLDYVKAMTDVTASDYWDTCRNYAKAASKGRC